ncbi:uncharacterized protein K460DRAFT_86056 [Cucurbitaria berberidis CBS 394.84]|uniref:Secreted protein n=1 Tax=Cucurbitaria berberidis CBS 394.84 TaxID=1168544 RepID=A0A9P4GMJ0_9PLEO|nr:uncharacterized protein K460DRAFT_86056 [Cucurbitaria berberidis CBS 394.84]KAF1849153.1 hypothetical protein K460DRAFT_86056 [Cucurbitaria berberidis CBS 394.84]
MAVLSLLQHLVVSSCMGLEAADDLAPRWCRSLSPGWSAIPMPVIHSSAPENSYSLVHAELSFPSTTHTNAAVGPFCCRALSQKDVLPLNISTARVLPNMPLIFGKPREEIGIRRISYL